MYRSSPDILRKSFHVATFRMKGFSSAGVVGQRDASPDVESEGALSSLLSGDQRPAQSCESVRLKADVPLKSCYILLHNAQRLCAATVATQVQWF